MTCTDEYDLWPKAAKIIGSNKECQNKRWETV